MQRTRRRRPAHRSVGRSDRTVILALVSFVLLGFAPAAASQTREAEPSTSSNPHGEIELECSLCHTVDGWSLLRAPLEWSHESSGFPLEDAHAAIDCRGCHAELRFETHDPVRDCVACHREDFDAALEPDHPGGGLPTACWACHGQQAWTPAASFDHASTGFLLEGSHRALECAACHPSAFAAADAECISCHERDYRSTAEPDHLEANLGTACESCHSATGWQPARFDHGSTAFPLQGAHRGVDCAACHVDGFGGIESECLACHQTDFQAAADPNHVSAGFDTACESCHADSGWQPARFDHNQTSFPLQGGHRDVECVACHAEAYTGTPTECLACHRTEYEATADPDHAGAAFDTACETCHTTTGWQPATFDHDQTSFALAGAHAGLDCQACHADGYTGTTSDCIACHRDDFEQTADPDHVAAGFDTACESCHEVAAWVPATFDHPQTAFALSGGHLDVDCQACHADGYTDTPTDCFACHADDFERASDPDHADSGFPTACESCHDDRAWNTASFDHDTSGFTLDGAHASVDCSACHAERFSGTPDDCVACHQRDAAAVGDPDHSGAGFSDRCESCHSTEAWSPTRFNHSGTGFELDGAHAQTDCGACHADGYEGTPTECAGCHRERYDLTTDPPHADAGFPLACESCHTTRAWVPAGFDHGETAFPLDGAHADADCESCHATAYAGTPSECVGCHEADYQGTADPDHASAGFGTSCESCHSTQAWRPATSVDHDQTAFPLRGAHRSVDCAECHADGYAGTSTECFACHLEDYEAASSPEHADAGFPTACESCHSMQAWSPADFDHSSTGFPLDGAHAQADCTACHADGYAGTPDECFACHEADYRATTDPSHASAGLPTRCETCHSTRAWEPADFDHAQTAFPLDGAHAQADCVACHADGYTGTPSDCFACHQERYDQTNDPPHADAGFPTTCETCHTTRAWTPATFDHQLTSFPLRGAHRDVDCESCHTDGYTGTPGDCYTCHREDYDATSDPSHADAGFPTTCESCHDESGWDGATWDHDLFFPIDSGAHREAWSTCADCHPTPGNYRVFECIFCHQQSQTDRDHDEVSGYRYESRSCLECHPDGDS